MELICHAWERVSLFWGGILMKRLLVLALTLAALAAGTAMAYNPYAPNQFDAMERNSWEYKTAYSLTQAGFMGGNLSKFAPSYSLTRYEMMEMVETALKERDRATIAQKEQIDKLAEAFSDDLKYMYPDQTAAPAAGQAQGQDFDWKQGTTR